MSSIKRIAAVAALAALVAGCADRQIGSEVHRADFGHAATGNVQAHLAALGGDRALLGLSDDFRRVAPDMINFAFDSAALDATARRVLDQQAAWIARHPQVRVRVYGHTDLVGSAAYNQQLGQRRANAAASYLLSRGVRPGQVEAVVSFGQTRPIVPTPNPERRNRRTVTEVIGYATTAAAGFDFDGKRAQAVYQAYVRGDRGRATPAEVTSIVLTPQ